MAKTFADAATRNAYSVGPYEVYRQPYQQLDTGVLYMPVRQGAGAENWEQFSVQHKSSLLLNLYDFREVTSGGDVANAAGIGGVLASDTTPIMRGDAAETGEIVWAAGNSDIIATTVTLPDDFDGTQDVTVSLFVRTDNAGGGGIDAATFTVETGWDGGALVSDTATDGTPATTMHVITATVAAADVPNTPSVLTLMLTAAAHAADPIALLGARVNYYRKAS